ncbi:hypothetical protein K9N50_08010 [bacterium]|nr:hypothetical protein [bacterium]
MASDRQKSKIKNQESRINIVLSWIQDNIRTMDATGGFKAFPDYPFIRNLIDALCDNRILIVCKSRQMMATWTVSAWMLYRAIHDEPGLYLMLSKGARDSQELLRRLKIIADNLPEDTKELVTVKRKEVEFKSGSRILSLPATEEAPRMHSPSAVFWDEMAFTPYTEGIWTAVKPAIDSGGSFIGVSTPNGTDNVFYHLYTDKSNGFGKARLHWREHPLRDNAWMMEAKRGLSEARWKQEYELDFSSLADRVYDEFDFHDHVLDKPFRWRRGSGRTYRGIDFGYRHPYVIWLHQDPDGKMTVFDEWEGFDAKVDEMMNAIKKIDAEHGVSEDDIYFSGCDPAGAAMSDIGISPVERMREKGFKLVYRTSEIMTGVELVKSLLRDAAGNINLRFSPNAKRTIHHLQHYRWDPNHDKPVKDNYHDHAADALRYLIVNLMETKRNNWSGAMVAGVKWR